MCRNTADDGIFGDVLHNDCIGTGNTVVFHGYISQNLGSAQNFYVILDDGIIFTLVADGHLLIDVAIAANALCGYNGRKAVLNKQPADITCIQIQTVKRFPQSTHERGVYAALKRSGRIPESVQKKITEFLMLCQKNS